MTDKDGTTTQGAIPMLAYRDGVEALEWLEGAFGFREVERIVEGDRLTHGTMDTGGGTIMMATPSLDYEGPRQHRRGCPAADRWLSVPFIVDGVLVWVDDVDAHFERAEAAGAEILTAPEEGFRTRLYRAADPEGHRWMFMQR